MSFLTSLESIAVTLNRPVVDFLDELKDYKLSKRDKKIAICRKAKEKEVDFFGGSR